MARAGIALGSNLGDRLSFLKAAFDGLCAISTPEEPVLVAAVYQTEPRFCQPGSPVFLNTVVEIDFLGDAEWLLAKTQALEAKLGRAALAERNAPRVIDIDILYLGEGSCENSDLVLPHPRLTERRFVLQPLTDIRPDLLLPGECLPIAQLLENLQSDEPPLVRIQDGL